MSGMVIIGAGECGVRAAFALRMQGYAGEITLIGAEAALPYERPPLSKFGETKPICAVEAYQDKAITLRLGEPVRGIDRATRSVSLAGGETLDYDCLLLATGARARLFPGMDGCLTLRTDKDAQSILSQLHRDARIGIVGGGFIGLELAALARSAGAEVTVFEAAPRLLGRAVPPQIAQVLQDRHLAEGVSMMLGTGVSSANATRIVLADGKVLDFDAVIAGVGALPNTDLAETAGLDVQNGIVVDGDFRTSDPHVFAAGDCCNFDWRGQRVRLESWKAAKDQGEHAASAMLGQSDAYSKGPWFWSDQYDLGLQVTGIFDLAAPIRHRNTGGGTTVVFQIDSVGTLRAAAGIGPMNTTSKDIRIFEKLIERGTAVDADALADPEQNLKRLLKAA
ncbi:NAD(P)/FAD-dependent oxidoreductase [Vannielia litorea]|uniref:NAD(P)/FAD-dependent oxidoreductase n=1 Tax=Vannielia litorea TaxID=1217970 RepID=UPI001BCC33D8|nr:FAD-dependent oxidoreductase [Vannielia litorea]MBS8225528.1 ferredoxin reductase [Vannielia litorea]